MPRLIASLSLLGLVATAWAGPAIKPLHASLARIAHVPSGVALLEGGGKPGFVAFGTKTPTLTAHAGIPLVLLVRGPEVETPDKVSGLTASQSKGGIQVSYKVDFWSGTIEQNRRETPLLSVALGPLEAGDYLISIRGSFAPIPTSGGHAEAHTSDQQVRLKVL
jgi:hypothetical protein